MLRANGRIMAGWCSCAHREPPASQGVRPSEEPVLQTDCKRARCSRCVRARCDGDPRTSGNPVPYMSSRFIA
jgi:hypothetical protein